MTAAPPRYRYVYAVPIRHSIMRGNVYARTESEARSIIAGRYGVEAAERATVTLIEPEFAR